ncbi:DNA polymerase III subunit gamma/tau [Chthonomonas calidirosea]|uniref:DNA polymerase III subunit gamma/tau n=1 Tax=Chthonomonas calidirosea TaxID=454171 RepID=UPI0006EC4CC8|nr:DNA polymerase III subunit gamma/tau [Chthonomonas calidirosea]CEK13024.1 DNA polymerase III, subunit gamma/tau [Chthonomonas calidirosea]
MAYVALYRKYRSQNFEELMGQDAVTTTLRNAIATKRFGHAYLFYGARGCGKTSTARLFARALNCEKGPTPNPCGTCRFCVAIREGTCLDVVEMDAASETGIDDVREKVIENVQYAPTEARYKVYIIDEVHDLSAKAFDALLKTLEEPPAHVVFILATTEFHKVPITIRSRCQCFQFRRGSLQDLGTAIERVAKAEGFQIERDAVYQIARAAEGSWRDALSLLEQIMAYSEGTITAQTVQQAIGAVDFHTLAHVTQVLVTEDLGAVFSLAGELLEGGADARQLLASLQGHLRDLAVLAAGAKQAALQEMGEERVKWLEPQASLFTTNTLLEMMRVLAEAEQEVRFSNHHRWIIERAFATLHRLARESLSTASGPQSAPAEPVSTKEPAPSRSSLPPTSATATPVPKPTSLGTPQTPSEKTSPADESAEAPSSEPSPKTEASDPRFAEEISLEVIRRAWPTVVERFGKVSPGGKAFLEKGEVIDLQGHQVVLAFKDDFARERIHTKGRDLLIKKINEVLRTQGIQVVCIPSSEQTSLPTARPQSPSPSTLSLAPSLQPEAPRSPLEHTAPSPETPAQTPPAETSEVLAAPPDPKPETDPFLAEVCKVFPVVEVKEEPLTRNGKQNPNATQGDQES